MKRYKPTALNGTPATKRYVGTSAAKSHMSRSRNVCDVSDASDASDMGCAM